MQRLGGAEVIAPQRGSTKAARAPGGVRSAQPSDPRLPLMRGGAPELEPPDATRGCGSTRISAPAVSIARTRHARLIVDDELFELMKRPTANCARRAVADPASGGRAHAQARESSSAGNFPASRGPSHPRGDSPLPETDFNTVTFVGAVAEQAHTEVTIGGEKRGALSWPSRGAGGPCRQGRRRRGG